MDSFSRLQIPKNSQCCDFGMTEASLLQHSLGINQMREVEMLEKKEDLGRSHSLTGIRWELGSAPRE